MGVAPNLFLKPIEPVSTKVVDRVRDAAPAEIQAAKERLSINDMLSLI